MLPELDSVPDGYVPLLDLVYLNLRPSQMTEGWSGAVVETVHEWQNEYL